MYTLTSPDGKIHHQTDHVLIDKRQHSSIVHVWSFRRADQKRLSKSKQEVQKYDKEKFNLKTVDEDKEQYQIKISYRFVASEDLMMITMTCTSTGLGKVSERIRKLQPQRT